MNKATPNHEQEAKGGCSQYEHIRWKVESASERASEGECESRPRFYKSSIIQEEC